MHASFVHFWVSLFNRNTIEWCHFSLVISFVFTILIFAMAFNQRNKINFNIISRLKMRSEHFAFRSIFIGFSFSWKKKSFFFRLMGMVGDIAIIMCRIIIFIMPSSSVWNVNETFAHLSVCTVCRCLSYEYSWDAHISHFLHHFLTCLIDMYARKWMLLYFQSATIQVHAKWVPIMSPYIVIGLDFLHRITFINCEHEEM